MPKHTSVTTIFMLLLISISVNAQPFSDETNGESIRLVTAKPFTKERETLVHASKKSLTKKDKYKKKSRDRYLLQFHQPTVASQLSTTVKVHDGLTTSSSQDKSSSKQSLLKQQAEVVKLLTNTFDDLLVEHQFVTLLNAVEVTTSENTIEKLRASQVVKAIYPVKRRYLNLDASHSVIETVAAWERVGGKNTAGNGIKIAVVDTGIRENHPMFDDTGLPSFTPTNSYLEGNPDYCRSPGGDPEFCNNKIVVARWIDPNQHGMTVYENEYLTPRGFDGHGTHVAGIASGVPVNVIFQDSQVSLSGVAPGSHLMVYKALYMDPFGQVYGTDTMLLQALELAVLDGADIINNSWGAGSGEDPDASIYQEVFSNAESLGVLMVNAAGNTGHPGATINCPACIESGIAVANTTHGRFFGHAASLNNLSFHVYEGDNEQLSQDISPILKLWEETNLSDLTGCTATQEPVFNGGIVLVGYQPLCPMEIVAQNVKDAGGDYALLYYADVFGQATYEPLIPFESDYVIPLFGLSQETALTLIEDFYYLADGSRAVDIAADVSSGTEEQFVDIVNPFSSTGPNNNPNYLKPDLSAPGTNIISAYSPDEFTFPDFPFSPNTSPASGSDGTFALLTGTSMAAPHVAGAAALVKQAHPNWSVHEIKSALTSTSETDVLLGASPAGPFEMGAGRLEIVNAIDAQLHFEQVSHSDPACIGTCEFSNTIHNLGESEANWQLSITFFDDDTFASVAPDSFSLKPKGQEGDQAQVIIEVDARISDPDHPLYKKWLFGRLTAKSSSGQEQHMPIAIYANDASDEGSLINYALASELLSTDNIPFATQVRNKDGLVSPKLAINLSDNAEFVEGSESVELLHGETYAFELSEDGASLIWEGELREGLISVEDTQIWDNFLLSEREVEPLSCDAGCQFVNAIVDFNFIYNGDAFSSLTISDNGFVVPGIANYGQLTALFNQRFPQPENLNNVIAPFWTEFDLLDPELPGDSGSGTLRAAIRVLDGNNYLVVEWDNVALYDSELGGELPPTDMPLPPEEGEQIQTDNVFTFQLIIQENTDNIWFHYISIPNIPEALTVGAENQDGTIGQAFHFDGEGSSLNDIVGTSGYSYKLRSQQEGRAIINYAAVAKKQQTFTRSDKVDINEDSATEIDVLLNDSGKSYVTASAILDSNTTIRAIHSAPINAVNGLQPDTLTIQTQPEFGTVSIANGKFVYTPQPNYFGNDRFSYTIEDGASFSSSETWVNVTIESINDAPEITAPSSITIAEGLVSSVELLLEDVDSNALTLEFAQASGPTLTIAASNNQLIITAPEVSRNEVAEIEVAVSDGVLSSPTQSIKVNITNTNTAGGVTNWVGFLLLLWSIVSRYRLIQAMKRLSLASIS